MKYRKMTRRERLAAEYFGYSLASYDDHLEVENERFTTLMPESIDTIERACSENWTVEQTAEKLEVSPEQVPDMLKCFREARKIADSPNSSEAFRLAVRRQIRNAVADGFDEAKIDDLVIQICFCAADLGCLLEWEGKSLGDYSQWLRREKGVGYGGIGLPILEPDSNETDTDPTSH